MWKQWRVPWYVLTDESKPELCVSNQLTIVFLLSNRLSLSLSVSVNTIRALCSLLSPIGGRGKKGGGFATVSSSYKVRRYDPVCSSH
jgi:hypothetical protein